MAKTRTAPLKAPQTQEAQDEYNENLHTFILNVGDELNVIVAFDLSAMTVSGKVIRYGGTLTFSADITEEV